MSKKDQPLPNAHIFKGKNKLTFKRNLQFMQEQLDLDAARQEQVLIPHKEINSVEENDKQKKNQRKTRPGQTFDQFNLEQHSKQQTECSICLQTHFNQGRYILECKHLMCNECFKYWSAVSIKCPVCFKQTQTVLTIFHGSTRTIKIKKDRHIPNCVKCGSNNNFHLMYFCDCCNKQCVHTYCDTSLKEERAQQSWLCNQCSINQYYQDRQDQEREFYQIDDFVVDDEYISSREVIDLDNAETRNTKRSAKNKQKEGKKEKPPKSKKNTNPFHKK